MDAATYGLIEIIAFFGGAFGFAVWQLRSIKRTRAEDARRKAEGLPDPEPGPRTKGDIFWDTVTRPRPKRD